mgnify:FL=1
MKKLLVSLFFFGLFVNLFAQQANYERAEEVKSYLLPYKYDKVSPFFTEGGDDFWFRELLEDGEKYYYVDLKAKKVEEFLDPAYMAREMEKATGRKYDPKRLGFWKINFNKGGETLNWLDGDVIFEYNRKTRKLTYTKRDKKDVNEMPRLMHYDSGVSPDGRYRVFGKEHNAYIQDLKDSTVTQLTFDGIPGFSHTEGWETTDEVPLAPLWFDDSKNFCLFRQDLRNLGEISNMNYLKGRPLAFNSPTILVGDSVVPYTEITVYDTETKTRKNVKIDKWQDQELRILHSDTKANKLYLERRARLGKMLDVCEVNLSTGDVKVIIHEEGEPYIGVELSSIYFLNDYKDIIWWSERTGYGHFYHYDGDGNLKNVITSGNWTAGKAVEIDEKNRTIYFQAYGITPGENPSYAKICKANIDGKGKVVLLTPEEATHNVIFSPSKKYIIDAYSRPDLPCQFVVRDTRKGDLVVRLGGLNLDSMYKKGWKIPETFSVKAADGKTDLYGVMWKPFDFDSTKRYPVISCVYPGPQTDNVPLTFEVGSTNEALAQVGFIVVAFNHRGGLPFRGRDYHTYGYNNIRDHALADDKCGLEQLIARYSFIDGNRVGIYGHSGGGMMSTAAICTYPDFYKACVSSAGNHDNNIYTQFFVENHYAINKDIKMVRDTLKAKDGRDSLVTREKAVYSTNLPTNMELARNLKGHLMLIVGGADGNVHPAQTIRMVDALINCGKDVEFVYLPQGRHTYDGVSAWYFEQKLRSHFAKYLLGDFKSSGFYDIEIDEYGRVK